MHRLGMHETFIKWTIIFLCNAWASVNLAGSGSNEFKVERMVRQGCPLALYFFLIIRENPKSHH